MAVKNILVQTEKDRKREGEGNFQSKENRDGLEAREGDLLEIHCQRNNLV